MDTWTKLAVVIEDGGWHYYENAKEELHDVEVIDAADFVKEAYAKRDLPFGIPVEEDPQAEEILFLKNPIYLHSNHADNVVIAHLLRMRIRIRSTIGSLRSDLPAKNTGKLLEPSAPMVVPQPEKATIMMVEGIIGAGKTTLLNLVEGTVFHEPTGPIYQTIQKCIALNFTRQQRQEEVEKVVEEYENMKIDIIPSAGKVYLERNWIYSRWVFGACETQYPSPDMHLAEALMAKGTIDGTYVIWTDPQESLKRAHQRGTNDATTLEEEIKLEKKLLMLYKCPYEWAFAKYLAKL